MTMASMEISGMSNNGIRKSISTLLSVVEVVVVGVVVSEKNRSFMNAWVSTL